MIRETIGEEVINVLQSLQEAMTWLLDVVPYANSRYSRENGVSYDTYSFGYKIVQFQGNYVVERHRHEY